MTVYVAVCICICTEPTQDLHTVIWLVFEDIAKTSYTDREQAPLTRLPPADTTYPGVVDLLECLVSDGAEEDDALEGSVSVLGHQLHTHHLTVPHHDVCKRLQQTTGRRRDVSSAARRITNNTVKKFN